MELYNIDGNEGMTSYIKYIIPYSFATMLMWIVILVLFYIIGLPLGIGAFPGI